MKDFLGKSYTVKINPRNVYVHRPHLRGTWKHHNFASGTAQTLEKYFGTTNQFQGIENIHPSAHLSCKWNGIPQTGERLRPIALVKQKGNLLSEKKLSTRWKLEDKSKGRRGWQETYKICKLGSWLPSKLKTKNLWYYNQWTLQSPKNSFLQNESFKEKCLKSSKLKEPQVQQENKIAEALITHSLTQSLISSKERKEGAGPCKAVGREETNRAGSTCKARPEFNPNIKRGKLFSDFQPLLWWRETRRSLELAGGPS